VGGVLYSGNSVEICTKFLLSVRYQRVSVCAYVDDVLVAQLVLTKEEVVTKKGTLRKNIKMFLEDNSVFAIKREKGYKFVAYKLE